MMTTIPHPALCGILLAAGGSSRLGEPKQILEWQGQSLVGRAADLLLEICGAGVTVVAGSEHQQVSRALADRSLSVVVNPDWETGMAGSLLCAIEAERPTACLAAMIMLCDQPLITRDDLCGLLDAWSDDTSRPSAAAYGGIVGVPAIIPLDILKGFRPQHPDNGAGVLLRARNDVRIVAMPHAAVDVDTPDDVININNIQ